MIEKHAVYANCIDAAGETLTLRIGLPIEWDFAINRWYRLDDRLRGYNGKPSRRIRVRYNRRWYTVDSLEVRSVDRHGRGLGSERHELAFPVPYRLVRSAIR